MHVNESLVREVRSKMNVIEGEEFRETFVAVANVVSEVLAKTLGPYASTTAIDDGSGFTYPTKDGWHVISNLTFSDPTMSTLLKFIKDISFSLNSKVGDGTTTAIVTANHFLQRLYTYLESSPNVRQADLISTLGNIKKEIIEELHSESRLHKITKDSITGYNDIYKIAMVASNGDIKIASIIKEIYDKTDNPNIHVTALGNSGDNETTYEIQDGYKLDSKIVLGDCYWNTDDKTYVINNPCDVVVFNHNVTYSEHANIIQDILNLGNARGRRTIILAPYFDEPFMQVFSTQIQKMVMNNQVPSAAFVQVPTSTQAMRNYLNDFTCLVGAQVFDYAKVRMYIQLKNQQAGKTNENDEYSNLAENAGFTNTDEIIKLCLGTATKLTLSSKFTLLENFDTTTELYKNTLDIIETEFLEIKAKYDKTLDFINNEYMNAHMRYIKFIGKTGIIHIGGGHDLVKQCNKDTIDDAVLACRSAFEYGYIRGFNIETIDAANTVMKKYPNDSIERVCASMIADAFKDSSFDVMRNKYPEYKKDISYFRSEQLWKVGKYYVTADDIINKACEDNYCYNIVTEEFESAGESIINSVSTDTEILNAAVDILTLIASSNQLLSINRQFDKASARENMLEMKKAESRAIAAGWAEATKEHPIGLYTMNMGGLNITGEIGTYVNGEIGTVARTE